MASRRRPPRSSRSSQRLAAPWTMTAAEQSRAGCRIGVGGDYPHPIVDHDAERKVALAMWKAASG
ncbi:MAG TPA: FAD-binding domain-containing protein [Thermoanaerobaculia bacterium]